eukprot:scaffold392754_cov49-Prasinocladus_malaysianus.AAC.1
MSDSALDIAVTSFGAVAAAVLSSSTSLSASSCPWSWIGTNVLPEAEHSGPVSESAFGPIYIACKFCN